MTSSRITGLPQPRKIFARSLLFLAVCEAATAASPLLAAESKSDNPLDTVVVVGNRGQARTLAESTAPVDVISSQQLLATG
ncbi:hypothetical protein GHO35_22890, partial [Pseudomonas helleri]